MGVWVGVGGLVGGLVGVCKLVAVGGWLWLWMGTWVAVGGCEYPPTLTQFFHILYPHNLPTYYTPPTALTYFTLPLSHTHPLHPNT